MKNLLFSFIPFYLFSKLVNPSNFIGDGRHHPITFSNDNYGFVVSGSYLNDVFKYDKINDTDTTIKLSGSVEDIHMEFQ